MENKEFTIRQFNRIAKQYNVELVHGQGYFYWYGLTEKTGLAVAGLPSSSVGVYRFGDLSKSQWLNELNSLLLSIGEVKTIITVYQKEK